MEQEIWKDIIGYESLYQISNLGRVKSLSREIYRKNNKLHHIKKEIILKPAIQCHGYLFINIRKNGIAKNIVIHRLVAIHFIDNPENKKCVNHINGIKLDNRIENLEWVTSSENNKHAYNIGLKDNARKIASEMCKKRIGNKNPVVKIKDEYILDIKNMLLLGVKQSEIAKKYGVNQSSISRRRKYFLSYSMEYLRGDL